MTLSEVADHLGMNINFVSRRACEGVIRGVLAGGEWSFEPSDVDAYIEASRIQPGTLRSGSRRAA